MTVTPNTTQGKGAVDWGRPIEAVHEYGRVAPVYGVIQNTYGISIAGRLFGSESRWMVDCEGAVIGTGWRIRNVSQHSTPTQYAPELVERMVGLCRDMASSIAEPKTTFPSLSSVVHYGAAQSIVSDLPQQVDPDLIEARDCVVRAYEAAGRKDLAIVAASGKMDGRLRVQAALLAIARGRQLQRGEAA